MILHLGKDHIVPLKDVIFILNYENIKGNIDTEQYLQKLETEVETVYITKEDIKSIIYVKVMGKLRLYYSPISPVTLYKRANTSGHDMLI